MKENNMSEKQSKGLRKNTLNWHKVTPGHGLQKYKKGRRVLFSLIRQGKLPQSVCPRR